MYFVVQYNNNKYELIKFLFKNLSSDFLFGTRIKTHFSLELINNFFYLFFFSNFHTHKPKFSLSITFLQNHPLISQYNEYKLLTLSYCQHSSPILPNT